MGLRPALLIALAALSATAQPAAQALVNLGRLSIAKVFSGDTGGTRSSPFYGIQNAFDGGTHIVNGINYSSWDSGPRDFALVRFSQPVTITGFVVEGSSSSWKQPPDSFTVQIRSGRPGDLFLSPAVAFRGSRAIYAPPRPISGVREVTLAFESTMGFGVEEIQILGTAPAGADLTAVTPPLDQELAQAQSSSNGAAQAALIRALLNAQMARMRAARQALDRAVDRAPDPARKAQAWLDLNRAADQLAELLEPDQALEPAARQAGALGVSIDWCDPGAHWFAHGEGFEQYLKLTPNGADADDAVWQLHFRACGDGEGSPEEFLEEINWLEDFLKGFPNSPSHAADARQLLSNARRDYEASKAPPKN
jgi:tetratricopeptide (TPR) repeat protein